MGKARTNPHCAEIAPVRSQNTVDLAAFGDGSHHTIDESQAELSESGVKLECARDIGRDRQFVFIAGCRIEDFRDQFAHRPPFASEKVVHLRKDQAGNDNAGGGDQDLSYSGKPALPSGVLARARSSPPVSATIGGINPRGPETVRIHRRASYSWIRTGASTAAAVRNSSGRPPPADPYESGLRRKDRLHGRASVPEHLPRQDAPWSKSTVPYIQHTARNRAPVNREPVPPLPIYFPNPDRREPRKCEEIDWPP